MGDIIVENGGVFGPPSCRKTIIGIVVVDCSFFVARVGTFFSGLQRERPTIERVLPSVCVNFGLWPLRRKSCDQWTTR